MPEEEAPARLILLFQVYKNVSLVILVFQQYTVQVARQLSRSVIFADRLACKTQTALALHS